MLPCPDCSAALIPVRAGRPSPCECCWTVLAAQDALTCKTCKSAGGGRRRLCKSCAESLFKPSTANVERPAQADDLRQTDVTASPVGPSEVARIDVEESAKEGEMAKTEVTASRIGLSEAHCADAADEGATRTPRVRMKLRPAGLLKKPSKKALKRAEKACRKVIKKTQKDKRAFTFDDMEKALNKHKFPVRSGGLVRQNYGTRKEVKLILGTVRTRDSRQMAITTDSRERPNLTKLANRVFADTNPDGGKFWYASITILKNASCGWHFDAGNAGPTWMTGVGKYSGGELGVRGGVSVEKLVGGANEIVLRADGDSELNMCCKRKWVLFNGKTMEHRSVPRSSTAGHVRSRYTFQFYTHSEFRKTREQPDFVERLVTPLGKMGFPVALLEAQDAD